ncbi:MAG: response regulator, partial [Chloroflexi bacterium]|nr:response regulator [Chloroflexota bacterium]
IFLAGAFTLIVGYVLLTFLERSLYPDLGFYALPLESVSIAFALVCLVQFAYHFPALPPDRRREARLALWLTMLLPLWEGGYAAYRYAKLAQGVVAYRPSRADYVVAAVFLWFLVVLLRQVGRADERPLPLWRKLWRPHGRPAHAARAFAAISMSPLWLMAMIILRDENYLSTPITVVLLSLGILFTLLAFVLVYLNTLPEATSFMVKLVAISLAAVLVMLGAVGQMISPAFIASYHNSHFIADHQTLRFTPNAQGGYDVTRVPFHFDDDWGADLDFQDTRIDMAFDFPFYDRVWRQAYLYGDGAVSFGQAFDWKNTLYRYGSLPAIFPLAVDFVNTRASLGKSSGFFARSTPEKLTVTWSQLPEQDAPENLYTLQLTLYPDGIFEITLDGLPATLSYDPYSRWRTAWVFGALPGSTGLAPPKYVRFDSLPFSGGPGGIVEDYHLDFRRALHRFLAPLAYLVLASTVLLTGGIPFVFRRTLVRPLNALLEGMREVDAGNLEVSIPVQYDDEFGSLTRSFNAMTGELRALVSDLEGRVAARTAELQASKREIERTHRTLRTVFDNLDMFIFVADLQNREILFASRKIRDAFGPLEGQVCREVLHEWHNGLCETCLNRKLLDDNGTPTGIHRSEFQSAHNGHWYSRSDSAISWTDGRPVHLSLAIDITATKQAETRGLTQQRALVALEEREHIGRELHDSLGQVLGYLNVQAQAAQALFADGKAEAGERMLARLTDVAQDAHNDVRKFILGMKGAPGEAQNFWDALREYAAKFEAHTQVRVLLSLPDGRQALLPPEDELHLLRIIQEALTNVRKHAGASQVQIIFSVVDEQMQVVIADDGHGFEANGRMDESATSERQSLGLQGMGERAGEIGGRLEVRSRPGGGTQVIVTFPLWDQIAEKERPSLGAGVAPKRVLLVDDHPMFLEGLRNFLSAYGLRVVGLARDGLQAQEMARTVRPDVILMDVQMPRCDGIEATWRIKREHPEIEIVMLTVSADEETLFEALKAGASGYLLKNMKAEDFFLLISGLETGAPPIAPQLAGKVLAEFQKRSRPEAALSDQQWEVLSLVAQGRTYGQIARQLHLSERTVKRYMKEILVRLHLKSRAEAEAYARQKGL